MKRDYMKLLPAFFAMILLASCEKDKEVPETGVINVVQAAIDVPAVKVFLAGAEHPVQTSYGAGLAYGSSTGLKSIKIIQSNDASKTLFDGEETIKPGGINSLYLFGQAPAFESLFVEENFPSFTTEQCGVRVVNLSPNGSGLNITLSATPTTNEFAGLGYKQITDFKTYAIPFTALPINFTFQVRDNGGDLLATYALSAANITAIRFKRATLVIRGLVGGTGSNSLGLSYVANY